MGNLKFVPIEKLDKSKKYDIVGIQKSGTTSLQSFLINKGFDVISNDWIAQEVDSALNYDYKRIPIIITRDPVKRAFSDFKFFPRDTLYEATFLSDYVGICSMWCGIIYSLEYLNTFDDFPHIHISERSHEKLTPEIELEIKGLLRR